MGGNFNSLLLKWVPAYGYRALTNIILPLQLSLLVFSLLYPNSVFFFFCLKTLIAISILILLIEHKKPTKQVFYDMLVILPGIWAAAFGILSVNPGVDYEISLYLLAPISYLIALRFSSLSFLKSVIPIIKLACAINLAVFFFLYFSKEGELYTVLQRSTLFVIQQLDGFNKVFTLQATQLIFLLPVILIHYYFKKNATNFILVAGCVLMTLLIGRKAILIMFSVLISCLCLYSLYQRRNLIHMIILLAPVVAAIAVFTQISDFDNKKLTVAMFNSFPSMQPLQFTENLSESLRGPQANFRSREEKIRQERALFESLYKSPNNICSVENNITLSKSSDVLGASIRNSQIQVLIQQIARAPWLGHGLGYIVTQCIRSEQQPWRFEITYLGMAMNIGLLGVFLYCIVYVRWLLGAVGATLDKSVNFPLLGGSLFFLICAASNPYIMAVEYLWIFFLPYLLVQIEGRKDVALTTQTESQLQTGSQKSV
jgi:hypothetical protein